MPIVNDVHSRLNETNVSEILTPRSCEELVDIVRSAARQGRSISICGGRHAMGGQQFLTDSVLVDTTELSAVIDTDSQRGLLTIQGGAQWPAIIAAARAIQGPTPWGIRQKQTGADTLTLGGSISCNGHGRGVLMGPMGEDIERLTLVNASGDVLTCSREENAELFSLVIGGYGLFGVILDATLRLSPRQCVRRHVDIIDIDDALNAIYRRVADGCIYGDFQYAIDPTNNSFLRRGVFACYHPVSVDPESISAPEEDLPPQAWLELMRLAHTDKAKAFQQYSQYYLSTHGRLYWSDTHQLGTYIPSYAEFLAKMNMQEKVEETLMITELYVPPQKIVEFMERARQVLRTTGVEDIYGTIRSIHQDTTSFLPWAREHFACIIFNLRTPHSAKGLEQTKTAARGLIDAAAGLGGSFYLTYHRWATREQLLECHPRLPEFIARKQALDPHGVFMSDWYRHLLTTIHSDS